MSADNGIYVLQSKCSTPKEDGSVQHRWRVAHASAIDNWDYYKNRNPHELSQYIKEVWGNSEVFYTEETALVEAAAMLKRVGYVEYGIDIIEHDGVIRGD